jgi:hypothetical protein
MESEKAGEIKEAGKFTSEEMVVGHYSDKFGMYSLKKIQIYKNPDGKKTVQFKKSEYQTYNEVASWDDFLGLEENQGEEIFTKEELLTDFLGRIKNIKKEDQVRRLSESAFKKFGKKNMSQYFVDNYKEHQEDWPETIKLTEKPGSMDTSCESSQIVEVETAEVIKGAF